MLPNDFPELGISQDFGINLKPNLALDETAKRSLDAVAWQLAFYSS